LLAKRTSLNSIIAMPWYLCRFVSSWPSSEPGQYIELFRNLARAIRSGEELQVKWSEATSVIEMVELAKQSSKEGRSLDVPVL
jgi:predicted dehydrogenase